MRFKRMALRASDPSALLFSIATLLLSAGCIADGRYEVRGTVYGASAGGTEVALTGASVAAVPRDPKWGRPGTTVTSGSGGFEVRYQYGGLLFPGAVRDGDPVVRITASGYSACEFAVNGSGAARPTLGRCAPGERFCREFNVLLKPEGAAEAAACEY